jgi:hypothetical protein
MSCVPTEPNAPDKSIPADLGCPSPTLSLCQYFQRINHQPQADPRGSAVKERPHISARPVARCRYIALPRSNIEPDLSTPSRDCQRSQHDDWGVTRGAERKMPFKTVNPATGELVRSFEEISDRSLQSCESEAWPGNSILTRRPVPTGQSMDFDRRPLGPKPRSAGCAKTGPRRISRRR